MSKFKYIIVDTFDAKVKGTNDEKVAKNFAECEDYYVIDVEKNAVMIDDGNSGLWIDIEEVLIDKEQKDDNDC